MDDIDRRVHYLHVTNNAISLSLDIAWSLEEICCLRIFTLFIDRDDESRNTIC